MATATVLMTPAAAAKACPDKNHNHIFVDLSGPIPERSELHGHCPSGKGLRLNHATQVTFQANAECHLKFTNKYFFKTPTGDPIPGITLQAGVPQTLMVAATGEGVQEETYYLVCDAYRTSGDPDPVIQP